MFRNTKTNDNLLEGTTSSYVNFQHWHCNQEYYVYCKVYCVFRLIVNRIHQHEVHIKFSNVAIQSLENIKGSIFEVTFQELY